MNRELIVTLLKKNIDDLILLTEGFEQMTSYPDALIQLAQLKTNDIKQYLYDLGDLKHVQLVVPSPVTTAQTDNNTDANEIFADVYTPASGQGMTEDSLAKEVNIVLDSEESGDLISGIAKEPVPETTSETKLFTSKQELQRDTLTESTEEVSALEIPYKEEEVVVIVEEVVIENNDLVEENEAPAEPENEPMEEPVVEVPETRKGTLGETIPNGITRNDIHSSREPGRFSNAMANQKIDDIRQAISIGDRFRFQRELFRNNGEEMNKMLNYINLLASFNEIEAFLQKKYGWKVDNEVAKDFYAIISRKFL